MKTGFVWKLLGGALLSLLVTAPQPLFAQSELPMITSVRPQGTNVLVVASIPNGIRRVLLESRSRLDSGAWAPVAVRSLDGTPQTNSFLVATSAETEMLRIRADAATPLPLSFYGGGKEFWGGAAENSPGFADLDAAGPGSREGTRDVVESDIWRISGDRLYFFNQYRGLQIIDISDPDKAVVQGTLPLPSSGEQMYLLETNHAVLLARDSCWSYTDGGQVLVVAVTNEAPALIKRLSVPGYTQESRMVGSALYVASQSYRQVLNTTNSTWEWGTTVSSFDLGATQQTPLSGTAFGFRVTGTWCRPRTRSCLWLLRTLRTGGKAP